MKKVLVIVDMQNDFVDGALGTPEAQAIVPKVADYIRTHADRTLFWSLPRTPMILIICLPRKVSICLWRTV